MNDNALTHKELNQMTRHNCNLRAVAVIAGLSMLINACTSSSSSGGSTSSTGVSLPSTSTIETTPDTVPATTSSTSTTVPAPIVFTLRGDGIGPFDLGVPASDLIDAFSAQFGPATSDVTTEYPTDDGIGGFQSADGEFGFFKPVGRTLCWSMQFCAEFGGNEPAVLQFAGWTYAEDSAASLVSTSGVTIGTRWSDAPATMSVAPGGCYSVGSGDVDGIILTLISDGEPFSSFDDAGNYIEGAPAREDVTVTFMQAGFVPAFLFGDC